MQEHEVVAAFVAHLEAVGWEVEVEKDHVDVVARRDGDVLYAEAKGATSEPGTDADILWGQILRRISAHGPDAQYALVVPSSLDWHVTRVSGTVREQLGISLCVVDRRGQIERADAVWFLGPRRVQDWPGIIQFAHTFDGYRWAEERGVDCIVLSNETRARYDHDGSFPSDIAVLRACLFGEARRFRHFGTDPQGEDLEYVVALTRAIADSWARH